MSTPSFKGKSYLLCDNWLKHIQLPDNSKESIRYCEIGVFYGANLLRFAELFPSAQLVGIDPWIDYQEYPEYRGQITNVYKDFCENLEASPAKDRITICRGFSQDILPTFEDQYFDIIYIDGNHEYEFVLRDAELAFQKVKVGGYIIFDDVDWETVRNAFFVFLEKHKESIKYEALVYSQTICRRYR